LAGIGFAGLGFAVVALVACGEPASPSPSLAPAPPSIVLGDWTTTDGHWTIHASVDPKGSPTDVFVEYGPGPAESPGFTESIVVENDLIEPTSISPTVDLPADVELCVRLTATNEVGSSSTTPRCPFPRGSIIIVEPSPST
jgi:hypothetical protein